MKAQDLKADEIYYNNYSGNQYIFTIKDIKNKYDIAYFIRPDSDSGCFVRPKDCNSFWSNKEVEQGLRLATDQEAAHLRACIAANKYVPIPEITNEYLLI